MKSLIKCQLCGKDICEVDVRVLTSIKPNSYTYENLLYCCPTCCLVVRNYVRFVLAQSKIRMEELK